MEDAVADHVVEDFAAIYDAHHRQLLRVAFLLRGELTAAEDDVADAFARTYGPWQEGRVDDVGAYLKTAVVNASRSAWRTRQRKARVRAGERPRPFDTDAPAERIADRELLREALQRLPQGQRAAVVLRYVGDCSEASTAAALGVSVGTVKSQVARGLANLRTALEGQDR